MKRFAPFILLILAGCCSDGPFSRNDDRDPPPLPGGGKERSPFDNGVERFLGPDRKFDPDIRPPIPDLPTPRLPAGPRAEDPSWKNR